MLYLGISLGGEDAYGLAILGEDLHVRKQGILPEDWPDEVSADNIITAITSPRKPASACKDRVCGRLCERSLLAMGIPLIATPCDRLFHGNGCPYHPARSPHSYRWMLTGFDLFDALSGLPYLIEVYPYATFRILYDQLPFNGDELKTKQSGEGRDQRTDILRSAGVGIDRATRTDAASLDTLAAALTAYYWRHRLSRSWGHPRLDGEIVTPRFDLDFD